MDDIRLFLKKTVRNLYKLSIAYRDGYNLYKYNFDDYILLFKETEEGIELTYNKKTYNNFNEIQLILFDLFDYKNIEYIDIYLQLKIDKCKYSARIEDIYNDYYDDQKKELICIRHIIIDEKEIEKNMKLKIIMVDNNDYTLYYNLETIIGFDEIIKKIDELFSN